MKRTLTLLFLGLLVTSLALAQGQQKPADKPADKAPDAAKPAEAMPTVDQVLDKYVQAIGGKAAIEKVTSRLSKGSLEIPAMGASGTAEIYEKAPNKSLAVITIPGYGVVQEGFTGTVAWSQDPQTGLREKAGAELADAKLESEFHKWIKMKQLYPKMTVKGKQKVGEREAYIVEAVPTEASTELLYFDVQTGLLLRSDAERETPQGKFPIETDLENYKEVDGIKMPFTIRIVTPAYSLNINIAEVKHNVAIEDAKFNKPAAQ